MAIAVLVADRGTGEPTVGPESAARLAELGIGRISLLQDGFSTAVVLEGWAFDSARASNAARIVFPGDRPRVQVLLELASVAVTGEASSTPTGLLPQIP